MIDVEPFEAPGIVHGFLRDCAYPYVWSVGSIAAHTVLRLCDGDKTAGFLWYRKETPTLVQIHVCVSKDYESRWLSRRVLKRLFEIGREEGVQFVMGLIDRPSLARLYRRLGANVHGPFAILPIPGFNDGLSRSKNSVASSSAPSASA